MVCSSQLLARVNPLTGPGLEDPTRGIEPATARYNATQVIVERQTAGRSNMLATNCLLGYYHLNKASNAIASSTTTRALLLLCRATAINSSWDSGGLEPG